MDSLAEVFAAYKAWVARNPQLTSDLETTVKWVSYFLAGKIFKLENFSTIINSL
jgi:peroxin-16